MTHSDFIKKSVLAGAGVVTAPGLSWALAEAEPQPGSKPKASLMGNRFVTLCIMIRTTP